MAKEKLFSAPVKGALNISGVCLGVNTEHREWDKDGVHKSMDLAVMFVQVPDLGVVVVRAYNPDVSFDDCAAGDNVHVPVNEYRIENGVKSVTYRA